MWDDKPRTASPLHNKPLSLIPTCLSCGGGRRGDSEMMSMDQSLQNKQGWGLFLAAEETVFFQSSWLGLFPKCASGSLAKSRVRVCRHCSRYQKIRARKKAAHGWVAGKGRVQFCARYPPTPILSHLPQCLRWGRTHTRGASKVLVNGRKERKKAERQVCVWGELVILFPHICRGLWNVWISPMLSNCFTEATRTELLTRAFVF